MQSRLLLYGKKPCVLVDTRLFVMTELKHELNKYILLVPFEIDGKEYKEIILDLFALSRKDIKKARREIQALSERNPEVDEGDTSLMLVAKMNNLIFFDLEEKLSGPDSLMIDREMASFFIKIGLSKPSSTE